MPKYLVTETRARKVRYLVDAVDAKAAGKLRGTILQEDPDPDDYGLELDSVERIEDEPNDGEEDR